MAAEEVVQQVIYLPEHLLEEIFVRLPPEDFYRCRCLSRFWAATLSSPDVMDRRLSLMISNLPPHQYIP